MFAEGCISLNIRNRLPCRFRRECVPVPQPDFGHGHARGHVYDLHLAPFDGLPHSSTRLGILHTLPDPYTIPPFGCNPACEEEGK